MQNVFCFLMLISFFVQISGDRFSSDKYRTQSQDSSFGWFRISKEKQRVTVTVFGSRLLTLEKVPRSLTDAKAFAISAYQAFQKDPNTRCTLILLLNLLVFCVFYGCLFLQSIVAACKYRRAMNMSKVTSSKLRLQQHSQYTADIEKVNRTNIRQNLESFRKQNETELAGELENTSETIYEEKF